LLGELNKKAMENKISTIKGMAKGPKMAGKKNQCTQGKPATGTGHYNKDWKGFKKHIHSKNRRK
jgi:hypothetical protein